MSNSLLPISASELEIATANACEKELDDFPVPLRQLWNPDTCPVRLLPYLAWAFSVDRWDRDWSEQTKRDVIKSSMFVHQHKGTRGAIRRAIEPLGYLVTFKEWWDVNQTPGTFRVRLSMQETALSQARYHEVMALIDEAKPVSRHLFSVDVEVETAINAYCGVVNSVGNIITVYPEPTPTPPFDVKTATGYQLVTGVPKSKPIKQAVGYTLYQSLNGNKPVKNALGFILNQPKTMNKPIKNVMGYLLVTEA